MWQFFVTKIEPVELWHPISRAGRTFQPRISPTRGRDELRCAGHFCFKFALNVLVYYILCARRLYVKPRGRGISRSMILCEYETILVYTLGTRNLKTSNKNATLREDLLRYNNITCNARLTFTQLTALLYCKCSSSTRVSAESFRTMTRATTNAHNIIQF